jgi:Lon protease-like protein
MSLNPFTPLFENLPATVPIFPLPNAVNMPGCQLPLNIFEPRYLNMVFDALGTDRLIGMVQPNSGAKATKNVAVYQTGTAGRIVSFSEMPEGRLLIILSGVCRFDIKDEIPTTRGYRRVIADWTRFQGDYHFSEEIPNDRSRLMSILKEYCRRKGLEIKWDILAQMPLVLLLNFLICHLPFNGLERQALIETVSSEDRWFKLIGFLEFEIAATLLSTTKPH